MKTFSRLGLHALLQRLVEFAQRLLGLDLVRDVGIGTEPADDVAGFIADGQSAREKPAIASVSATQRKRVLPRRTVFETLPNALDDAIDMFRMVHLLPAPAFHFVERSPRVVVPTFVVPISPAGSIGGPSELADVVG